MREALTLTPAPANILQLSLAQIVDSCSIGGTPPATVRDVFLKQALKAHAATNCIAEFLPNNSATPRAKDSRPFLGVPISIKDQCDYEGTDTTLGYSCNVNKPASSHSVIAQMLLDAGATLHVKTTVPTGLIALETDSDLYGYCENPYNPAFASGASTGGGAALLAFGGSKIEIGSDLGGAFACRLTSVECIPSRRLMGDSLRRELFPVALGYRESTSSRLPWPRTWKT